MENKIKQFLNLFNTNKIDINSMDNHFNLIEPSIDNYFNMLITNVIIYNDHIESVVGLKFDNNGDDGKLVWLCTKYCCKITSNDSFYSLIGKRILNFTQSSNNKYVIECDKRLPLVFYVECIYNNHDKLLEFQCTKCHDYEHNNTLTKSATKID